MLALNILGIRGVPGAHGGFESFATRFAPYMKSQGWVVTVYCQEEGGISSPRTWVDEWEGIRRVHFDTRTRGSLATVEFDLRCTLHVLRQPGIDLVLGYNTAIFTLLQRLVGRCVAMNMDGIEWKRQKWGQMAKAWFWLNEWIGALTCSQPIADHPGIADHLADRGCHNSVIIPYGAESVADAPVRLLTPFGVTPGDYFLSISRIEPENSILELVRAFVAAGTDRKFVVLGKTQATNPYHEKVRAIANDKVIFPGAIYDHEVVAALRYHCLAYMHGHQVGGTNPSLVEALGAGSAVIAHDNVFNRWVAGPHQFYFADDVACADLLRRIATEPGAVTSAKTAARERHAEIFTFENVHEAYRKTLTALALSLRAAGRNKS